jgi:hypothetical protein
MTSDKLKMYIFQDCREKTMEARESNENKLIKGEENFSNK